MRDVYDKELTVLTNVIAVAWGSTPTLPPRRHCLPSESGRARGCEMGTLLLCESLWGMLTARHRMRDIEHAGLNGRDKHIPKQDMILDCQ